MTKTWLFKKLSSYQDNKTRLINREESSEKTWQLLRLQTKQMLDVFSHWFTLSKVYLNIHSLRQVWACPTEPWSL